MNNQCQSCGSYNNGIAPTASCEGCSAVICSRCKTHHKTGCDEIQRRKRLGQGPTVLVTLEQPVEVLAAEALDKYKETVQTLLIAPNVVEQMAAAGWKPNPLKLDVEAVKTALDTGDVSVSGRPPFIVPMTEEEILNLKRQTPDLPAQWTQRPEPTVFDSAVLEQMKTDGTVVDATIPAVAEEPEAQF